MKKVITQGLGFADALQTMVGSYHDLQKVRAEEETKQFGIESHAKISIEEIRAKRDIIVSALENDHQLNQEKLKHSFKVIDHALETGDLKALEFGLGAMVKVAETSSLLGLSQLTKQLEDNSNIIDL